MFLLTTARRTLALVLLVLAACSPLAPEAPAPTAFSVAQAQAWLSAQQPVATAGLQGGARPAAWAPNWRYARLATDGADHLVLAPLSGDSVRFAKSTLRGRRYLVASQGRGQAASGLLVELLTDHQQATFDTVALLKAVRRSARTGRLAALPVAFTGRVLVYDEHYAYQAGSCYERGRATPAGVRLRLVTQAPAGASSAQQKAGPGRVANLVQEICTDWYQQDDSGKYIYLATTCEYVNVGSGSTGGSYSGGWGGYTGGKTGGGGGTTSGTATSVTPCEVLKKLGNDPKFTQLLKILASKLNLSVESGYLYTLTNGVISTIIESQASTAEKINLGVDNPVDGYMHNHIGSIQSYSIFSAGDILAMYSLVNEGRAVNNSSFSFQMINSQGQAYSMIISDIDKFKSFGKQYFESKESFEVFETFFFENKFNIKEGNSSEENEINFMKMIKISNLGITLLKSNSLEYNKWSKVELNLNNQVQLTNCI